MRIFTTQEELPFAGHPTLGTACTVRSFFPEYAGAEQIVLDLNIGKIPVQFSSDRQDGESAIWSDDPDETHLWRPPRACQGRRRAGLAVDDLLPGAAPQTVSTGLAYAWCRCARLRYLAVCRYPSVKPRPISRRWARGSSIALRRFRQPNTWQARMQFYNGEDPATGSAAGCAISYLVEHSLTDSGQQVHLRQGVEIGRASDLFVSAQKTGSGIDQVRVGGSTVPVAKGVVFLERFT